MNIDVMGTTWTIVKRTAQEDTRLKTASGFADWSSRTIVIEADPDGDIDDMKRNMAKILRHEIVHAFLTECGLMECSGSAEAWALNETMVDWFARIGERIHKAWRDAGCLEVSA